MISDDLLWVAFISNVSFGALLALGIALSSWEEWADKRTDDPAEGERCKRIWSRFVLTSPLWVWWYFLPALVLVAIYGAWVGGCALYRMAFPIEDKISDNNKPRWS